MAPLLINWDKQNSRRRLVIVAAAFTLVLLIFTATSYYRPSPQAPHSPPQTVDHAPTFTNPAQAVGVPKLTKPEGVPIVGYIFFGRKSRVEILRCYIERNLVDNGGWLDEVHWVRNTDQPDDLAYLEEILKSSPRYKMIDLSSEGVGFAGYNNAWNHMERGKLYVKIDDDVVWMADDTIPRLVSMKVAHPEYFIVSANIINSPLMGWMHYHMGAVHPYLPEFKGVFDPPSPHNNGLMSPPKRKSWKYTDYPEWEGPDDWYFDLDQDPPYEGHRWLRLKNDTDLHRTPITEIQYDTWGTGLKSWAIVAQEHYSFLENLLDDHLDLYKFKRVWLADYERLSINLMILWADEVLDNLPMDTVDEEWLTKVLPKRIGKSVAVESEALGAHFSFSFQESGLITSDVLPRYKDYAEENVCHH